ncbi:MAG: hypothetical protein J7L98_01245 [Candidatus Verstraetearchaeota archaeon]|nr:hypothetical protein [Candidatus Verstraetearchaeota archaeon]
MSRKPRSAIKIYVDILKVVRGADGRARPTKILYGANLSYERMQRYLAELVKKELLREEQEEGVTYYVLTEKGYRFLMEYERFERFARAFGFSL